MTTLGGMARRRQTVCPISRHSRPAPAEEAMDRRLACLGAALVACTTGLAADCAVPAEGSAGRGRDAVRGRPALNPPVCSVEVYEGLWRRWGLAGKPAGYARAVRERYGLYEAPYENGGLPMGLHAARGLLGTGVGTDCLVCHGGAVA